jgi:hypothetical protein
LDLADLKLTAEPSQERSKAALTLELADMALAIERLQVADYA